MRGATIWNVTEPSGPGPGHDYVQITLGQSPVTITPPSLSQLMRSKGPEKYKHTLTRCYCHFPHLSNNKYIICKKMSCRKRSKNSNAYYNFPGEDWLCNATDTRLRPMRSGKGQFRDTGAREGGTGQKGLQTMTNLPDMCQNYPLAWPLVVFVSDRIPG